MARRLALGYALIATLWCVQAVAIGLGEITIHSALNQPLDAEIELLEAQGMSESEIVAQLATADDFKRVGVERFFFLTGLQFRMEMRAGRSPILRVTSAQPITEPYLNFLVQVIWPNGRLLKEYTVLLDPPTYQEQAAPAVASPGRSDSGGGSAGRVERTPTKPDSEVSLSDVPRSTPPASQSPPSDRLTGDSYGATDRDDTLWRIAQRARPSADVTVQQTMLALVRLNPEAFIGGNINLVKAGYTLRLPSDADATTLSTADAMSEVAAQNEAWRSYQRGEGLAGAQPGDASTSQAQSQALAGQVDATAPAPAKPAVAGPEGELRIVAGDAADGGTGSGGGTADVAALAGELAATKEEADRISQERDEAVSKLDQVASQAEQSQRQIEVRDQQIAQMQQQLKTLQQADGTAAAPVAPRTESRGGIGSWLTSPFVLGGAGIVVVLIVVAGLMQVRKRRRVDADQIEALNESVGADSASVRRGAVATLAADDAATSSLDVDEAVVPTEDAPDPASHEVAQTGDVIGEADIYIAYGRYPQAVSLLLGALEDDPNRSDVRVKLLEVYAETKDESGFETHMTELMARCDDNEILLEARDLETKLREDQPIAVAAPEQSQVLSEDEFRLDLDDSDAAPARGSIGIAPATGDLGGDLGIDFKADDEPAAPRPAPSAAAVRAQASGDDVAVATADDEDEFDLEDLEFEPQTRNAPKARPGAKDEASDDAFDFLNEEDAATTKLDLARAYIDMGDEDGAREILGEVLQEGSNEQQQVATELLAKLK